MKHRNSSLMFSLAVGSFVALAILAMTVTSLTAAVPAFGSAIKEAFDRNSDIADDELSDMQLSAIHRHYESVAYKPIWTDQNGVNKKAHQLDVLLVKSYRHGFSPSDYGFRRLSARFQSKDASELARLEVDLSRAFIAYAHDLVAGRVDPESVNRSIHLDPRVPPVSDLLRKAATESSIIEYARKLEPNSLQYRRTIVALDQLRHAALGGGWTKVPGGPTLKPGTSDGRVSAVRVRLTASGDMRPGHHSGEIYDDYVEAGVRAFQARHGLGVDGVVGPNTLRQLNVSILDRIEQLEINLERRRWLKDDLGSRYIFVNLAAQDLRVIENDRRKWKSPVVVGKPYHATPVFVEKMEYIVINPRWNIPRSITVNEMLPKLKRDPGSLARRNITIRTGWGANATVVDPWSVDWRSMSKSNFPYRMQQGSGPGNALGRIKFMFPNSFNIYIHDTPAKQLFSRAQRALSHGCIRVQDPSTLARHLLDEQGWSKTEINNQIRSGQRRIVSLKRPWPVYVTYMTAWIDEDGVMQFRRDIYGRDNKLRRALRG